MLVPVTDADASQELIPDARAWSSRHRPRADDRAPVRFNELLREFLAGERRAVRPAQAPARGRPRSGLVTAPSEALETSFAYLASTPLPRRRRRAS